MMTPQKTTGLDHAFGPSRIATFLPPYADLPEEFRRERNPWCQFVQDWFFKGADKDRLKAKPGVDWKDAVGHCATIMRSFEPKHEHKVAGVAYLLSLWFEPLETAGPKGSAVK